MRINKDKIDTTWMPKKVLFEIEEKRKNLLEETIDVLLFTWKMTYPIIIVIITCVAFLKGLDYSISDEGRQLGDLIIKKIFR